MVSVRKIDLSRVDGYSLTLEDALVGRLKKDGLFGPDYLYSGFSAEIMPKFRQFGTYRFRKNGTPKRTVFCSEHEELLGNPSDASNAFWYASIQKEPALSVYKKSHLYETGCLEYAFVNEVDRLSAVAAVYLIEKLEINPGFEPLGVRIQ